MIPNKKDTPKAGSDSTSPAAATVGVTVRSASESTPDKKRLLMRAGGLRKAFGGQLVLNGVDFELYEGQVVLLRGANGSGKTTLLNMLTGHIKPDAGTIELRTNGAVEHFHFPRKWWKELNPWDSFLPERLAREGVGRSWQDTRLFPTLTLRDNIVVAGREDRHGHNPAQILFSPKHTRRIDLDSEDRASHLLSDLGLGDRAQSSADKVSLGQTKRVAIARAVHAGAKILFLDEPLSGLDAPGVRSVLDLLKSLVDSHRLTLVIIEHVWNARHILPLADTLWTLDQGMLSQATNDSPTHQLDDSLDQGGSGNVAELFPEYRLSQSLPLPRDAVLDIYRRPDADSGEPLLSVQDLVVFRAKRLVIGSEQICTGDAEGLSFVLRSGDLAVLRAPNGWGKTTLLEAMAGILPCEGGGVRLGALVLTSVPSWVRYNAGLVAIPAQGTAFNALTVAEYRRLITRSNGLTRQNIIDLPAADRLISSLSGGELRQLTLETVSYTPALVRIWDEPFGSLDARAVAALAPLLQPDSHSATLVMLPRRIGIVSYERLPCNRKGS